MSKWFPTNKRRRVTILIIAVIIIVFVCFYVTHNYLFCRNAVKKRVENSSLEASLVLAVCKAESNFNCGAVSVKGAKGVMQLTDATFMFVSDKYFLGYSPDDIFDADKNIDAGCRYLEYLFERFFDEYTVLCAYNAGEGNVKKWLEDERYSHDGKKLYNVPYKETARYVEKVLFYKGIFDKL